MWEAIRFVAHQYEVSPPKQYLQNLKWNGDKNAIRNFYQGIWERMIQILIIG